MDFKPFDEPSVRAADLFPSPKPTPAPAAIAPTPTPPEEEAGESPSDYYDRVLKGTPTKVQPPGETGSGIGNFFKGLAYGAQSSAAALPKALDRFSNYVAEKTGTEKGSVFQSLADAIKPEDIDELTADELSFKIGKTISGIGGGVAQIGTLTMLGVPPPVAMAIVGGADAYAEGAGPGGVAVGTALGGATGTLFGGLGSMRGPLIKNAVKAFQAAKTPAEKEAALAAVKALQDAAKAGAEAGGARGFLETGVTRMGRPTRMGILGGAGAAQSVGSSIAQTGQLPKAEDLAIDVGTMAAFGAMGGPGDKGMRKTLIKRGFPEADVSKLSYDAVQKMWKEKMQPPPPEVPPPPPPPGQATVEGMLGAEGIPGAMQSQGPTTQEAMNSAQLKEIFGEEPEMDWRGKENFGQPAEVNRQEQIRPEEATMGAPEVIEGQQLQGQIPAFPGMTTDQMTELETGQSLVGPDLNPRKTAETAEARANTEAAKSRRSTNTELLVKTKGFRKDVIDILEDTEVDKLVLNKANSSSWELNPLTNEIVKKTTKGKGKAPHNMKLGELEYDLARTLNGDRAEALRTEIAKRKSQPAPTKAEAVIQQKKEAPIEEETSSVEDILGEKEVARRAAIAEKKKVAEQPAPTPVERITEDDVNKAKIAITQGKTAIIQQKRDIAEWFVDNKGVGTMPGDVVDHILGVSGSVPSTKAELYAKLDNLQKFRQDHLDETNRKYSEYKQSIVREKKAAAAKPAEAPAKKATLSQEEVLNGIFSTEKGALKAREGAGLNPEKFPVVKRGDGKFTVSPVEETMLGESKVDLAWKEKKEVKKGEREATAEEAATAEGKGKGKLSKEEQDIVDEYNKQATEPTPLEKAKKVPNMGVDVDEATFDLLLEGKTPKEILDFEGEPRGPLTKDELDYMYFLRTGNLPAEPKPASTTKRGKKIVTGEVGEGTVTKKAKTILKKKGAEQPLEEAAAEVGQTPLQAQEEIIRKREKKAPTPENKWVATNVADATAIQESLHEKSNKGIVEKVREVKDRYAENSKQADSLAAEIEALKLQNTQDDAIYNQIKLNESKIEALKQEMNKDKATLELAKKKTKSGELAVGESKALFFAGPFPKEANNRAVIVQTRVADNVNEFSVFEGADTNQGPSKENPGHQRAVVKVGDVKGKSAAIYETIDPTLDKGYVDALLDKVLDSQTKNGKTTPIEITDATPKLKEAVERRKPVAQPEITLAEGLGILGDMDDIINIKAIGENVRKLTEKAMLKWRKTAGVKGMVHEPIPSPEGKPGQYKKFTMAEEAEYLRKIVQLRGTVDPSLLNMEIRKDLQIKDYLSILDYLGDPIQSMDPKIRTVAALSQKREYAERAMIRSAFEYRNEHFDWLRGKPEKQKELIQVLHGMAKSNDPMINKAVADYKALMEDFARVGDLKAKGMWREDYATIAYDYNKLYDYFAEPIRKVEDYEKLPSRLASFIRPEDYPEIRKIVKTYDKPFDKLPAEIQEVLHSKVFGWTGAQTWQDAPAYVQNLIPKEKWNAYFQHRTAGESLKTMLAEDFFKMFDAYVISTARAVSAEPYLKEVRPIVNSMPGATNFFSKRSYLEKYVKSQLWGRNSAVDKIYNSFASRVNKETYDLWNVQPLPLYLPSKLSGKFQQYTYRGTMGPDTAIRNLIQNFNTFAEGKNVPVWKALQARMQNSKEWTDFKDTTHLLNEFSYHTGGERAKGIDSFKEFGRAIKEKDLNRIDDQITEWSLGPLNITENVNKFLAYMQGLENARMEGLDFNQAHLVGIDRAFNTIENPMMTEAQWKAWSEVWKTQFGYTPSHQSPYMRDPIGRASTIFWSYPAKTAQLWRTGMQESAMAGDQARFLRYAALAGGNLTAHYWLGKALGIDLNTLFGIKGLLPNDFTPVWLKFARDAYTAAGGADAPEYSRENAKNNMLETMKTIFIPQYRYLKKASPVAIPGITDVGTAWQAIDDGYMKKGKTDQPLVETNTYQQILNMAGFPPLSAREMRAFQKELKDKSAKVVYQRQKAINDILRSVDEKRITEAYSKMRKYHASGVDITMSQVMDAKKRSEMDVLSTFEKTGNKQVRKEYSGKIEEMKKKYLPNTKNGKRNMWSSEGE